MWLEWPRGASRTEVVRRERGAEEEEAVGSQEAPAVTRSRSVMCFAGNGDGDGGGQARSFCLEREIEWEMEFGNGM